jgi:pimeloyl-ACP methyl ester carboxylesterase
VDDADLYLDAPAGAGDPLVLVHGGWTDHTTWNLIAGPLAERFRVIRYDRRGHSRSARGAAAPVRRRHEDDLAALIELLGCAPATLVGSSYGAIVALALAGRRPDLVAGVVAHEPPALALAPDPDALALLETVGDQIRAGDPETATERFFEQAVLGPGGWQLVPEPVQRAAIANAGTYVDMLDDPGWDALDTEAVAAFDGPILITHGDSGPAWLRRTTFAVARGIDRPTALIEGAGHTPHHTHPERFAALIAAVAA